MSVVDPGAVLADVGHLEEVGVQAALVDAAPEGHLVHVGRAGRHHHAGEPLLLDGLLDGRLAGLGTRVDEVLGVDHVLEAESPLGDARAVDRAGDVGAAMADEDAYPHGARLRGLGLRVGPPPAPGPRRRGLAALRLGLGRLLGRLLLPPCAPLRRGGGSLGDGPFHKRPGVDHVLLQHALIGS